MFVIFIIPLTKPETRKTLQWENLTTGKPANRNNRQQENQIAGEPYHSLIPIMIVDVETLLDIRRRFISIANGFLEKSPENRNRTLYILENLIGILSTLHEYDTIPQSDCFSP